MGMSREHIYRAKRVYWRKLPKEIWWVDGDLIHEPYGTVIQYYEDEINDKGNCTKTSKKKRIKEVVDPETVCEYTGLTDKNGRKIFEGDIVETVYDGKINPNYVVVWDDDELDFKATNGKEYYKTNYQYLGCCDEIIVIGSIFDNPELLEGDVTE